MGEMDGQLTDWHNQKKVYGVCYDCELALNSSVQERSLNDSIICSYIITVIINCCFFVQRIFISRPPFQKSMTFSFTRGSIWSKWSLSLGSIYCSYTFPVRGHVINLHLLLACPSVQNQWAFNLQVGNDLFHHISHPHYQNRHWP